MGSFVRPAALVFILALFAPDEALAVGAENASRAKPAKVQSPPRSVSVGSPNEGRLDGGKKLEPKKSLRLVGGHRWGVPSLVGMLERSAAEVAKRFPGSVLSVGDLSRKGGGDVDGHRSHESGRDADVGFYLRKGKKPWLGPRFSAIDVEGNVVGQPAIRFDDARNWALVQAWLSDRDANVLQIFVAQHVKVRLLAEARRVGAPAIIQNRAAFTLIQPSRGLPHDNHFHVRVACPRTSDDCIEYGTRPTKPPIARKPSRAPVRQERATLKRRNPKKS